MESRSYEQLLERVRTFVDGPAREYADEIENSGHCGLEMWKVLREQGFLRLAAPEELGGMGLTFGQYVRVLETFSHMHGSLRMIVHVSNGIWRPTDWLATPEQRERFVMPSVRGEKIIAFTLTEPIAGSGMDLHTFARREGEEYVLEGEKWLITFGDIADYFLLFARLEGSERAEGSLALMVPRDAPGLEVRNMEGGMGLAGTGHGHLFLRKCRVPATNRLGAEGEGLAVALNGFLDPSRICIGATCVGLAERAFELAMEHARTRITFGKPLAKRQIVQMWIAEMATDIEGARALVHQAAEDFESGKPATRQAAMSKLAGLEMLQRVTDKALQIYGGAGYIRGNEIERIYRDARAQRFEEGTAEIQKMVIARDILGTRSGSVRPASRPPQSGEHAANPSTISS